MSALEGVPPGRLFSTAGVDLAEESLSSLQPEPADFDGNGVTDRLSIEPAGVTVRLMGGGGGVLQTLVYKGEELPANAPLEELWLEQPRPRFVLPARLSGSTAAEVVLLEEGDLRVLRVTATGFDLIAARRGLHFAGQAMAFSSTSSAAQELWVEPNHTANAAFSLQRLKLKSGSLEESGTLGPIPTTEFAPSPGRFTWRNWDVNGDGAADVLLPGEESLEVRLQRADGTLSQPVSLPLGAKLAGMARGDVNGDGKQDIVTFSTDAAARTSARVLLGNGNGDFGTAGPVTDVGSGAPLFAVDLSGDGAAELVTPTHVYWFVGDVFAAGEPLGSIYESFRGLADLNADGILDALVSRAPEPPRYYLGVRSDLVVTFVSAEPRVAGRDRRSTFRVENRGPSPSGKLDIGLLDETRKATIEGAVCAPGSACVTDSLPAGDSRHLVMVESVWDEVASSIGLRAFGEVFDPNPKDNEQEEPGGDVEPRVDLDGFLSLVLNADESSLFIPVTVLNNGPSTATGVTVSVSLPNEVSSISVDTEVALPSTCDSRGNQVTCSLPSFPNGAWTLEITGRIPYTGQRIEVKARVASVEVDQKPENNEFGQVIAEGFLGRVGGPRGQSSEGGCGCRTAGTVGRGTTATFLASIAGLALIRRARRAIKHERLCKGFGLGPRH